MFRTWAITMERGQERLRVLTGMVRATPAPCLEAARLLAVSFEATNFLLRPTVRVVPPLVPTSGGSSASRDADAKWAGEGDPAPFSAETPSLLLVTVLTAAAVVARHPLAVSVPAARLP